MNGTKRILFVLVALAIAPSARATDLRHDDNLTRERDPFGVLPSDLARRSTAGLNVSDLTGIKANLIRMASPKEDANAFSGSISPFTKELRAHFSPAVAEAFETLAWIDGFGAENGHAFCPPDDDRACNTEPFKKKMVEFLKNLRVLVAAELAKPAVRENAQVCSSSPADRTVALLAEDTHRDFATRFTGVRNGLIPALNAACADEAKRVADAKAAQQSMAQAAAAQAKARKAEEERQAALAQARAFMQMRDNAEFNRLLQETMEKVKSAAASYKYEHPNTGDILAQEREDAWGKLQKPNYGEMPKYETSANTPVDEDALTFKRSTPDDGAPNPVDQITQGIQDMGAAQQAAGAQLGGLRQTEKRAKAKTLRDEALALDQRSEKSRDDGEKGQNSVRTLSPAHRDPLSTL